MTLNAFKQHARSAAAYAPILKCITMSICLLPLCHDAYHEQQAYLIWALSVHLSDSQLH